MLTVHENLRKLLYSYFFSFFSFRHGRTLWTVILTRCWAPLRKSFSSTRTQRNISLTEITRCSGTFWTFTAQGSSITHDTSASRPLTKSWPSTASCRRSLETAAWRYTYSFVYKASPPRVVQNVTNCYKLHHKWEPTYTHVGIHQVKEINWILFRYKQQRTHFQLSSVTLLLFRFVKLLLMVYAEVFATVYNQGNKWCNNSLLNHQV